MDKNMPYLLVDSARLLRRAFEGRVRGTGATAQQARLLLNLERTPGQNQTFYAEKLEIEPITLCRMVDRMEESGLIERRADPADRRARQLHLTTRSQGEIERIRGALAGLIEAMLDGFSEAEEAELGAMLARIADNLAPQQGGIAAHG